MGEYIIPEPQLRKVGGIRKAAVLRRIADVEIGIPFVARGAAQYCGDLQAIIHDAARDAHPRLIALGVLIGDRDDIPVTQGAQIITQQLFVIGAHAQRRGDMAGCRAEKTAVIRQKITRGSDPPQDGSAG